MIPRALSVDRTSFLGRCSQNHWALASSPASIKTFPPIFRKMNASGGILKYDSSSLFIFSEGCITFAMFPDRLKPSRWSHPSITLWALDFAYSLRVHSHFFALRRECREIETVAALPSGGRNCS